MTAPGLLLLAGLAAAQAGKPQVQWGVTPDPVVAGQSLTVTVAPFGSKARCFSSIAYQRSIRVSAECGQRTAKLVLPEVESSTSKTVSVNLSVCFPTGYTKTGQVALSCHQYSKDVRKLPGGAAPPAHRAGAPAAKPAPEPPPEALPDKPVTPAAKVPEGGPIAVARARRADIDEDLLARLEGRARVREVRDLLGRVHVVADPPEDSLAAKDERYRVALLKDEQVRKAYDGWEGLDEQAKLAALRRASELQARSYGIAPVPVELGSIEHRGTLAHYAVDKRRITVDASKPLMKDPDVAFNVISHESRHSWQHQLVEQLDAGRLAAGGEEAELAAGFKKSFAEYCCVRCRRACDWPTYREQLVERDAFEQGEGATSYLASKRARAAYEEYLAGGAPGRGT